MDKNYGYSQNKSNVGDFCLTDSATTHTILRDRKYFSNLILAKVKVTTISGKSDVIEGLGKAQIIVRKSPDHVTKWKNIVHKKCVVRYSIYSKFVEF